MKDVMTMTEYLIECPACHQNIMAAFSFAIGSLGPVKDGVAQMSVHVTGCRVHHDCVPKVMR